MYRIKYATARVKRKAENHYSGAMPEAIVYAHHGVAQLGGVRLCDAAWLKISIRLGASSAAQTTMPKQ